MRKFIVPLVGSVVLAVGIVLALTYGGAPDVGSQNRDGDTEVAPSTAVEKEKAQDTRRHAAGIPPVLSEALVPMDIDAIVRTVPQVRQANQDVEDATLRRFVDRDLPLSQRAPDDLLNLLHELQDEGSRELVRALLLDPSEDILIRHEAANLLWRSEDTHLVPSLLYIAFDSREGDRMRGYAVQHLHIASESGLLSPQQCMTAMEELLERPLGTETEGEALLALVRLGHPATLRDIAQPEGRWMKQHPALVLQAWTESKNLSAAQEEAVLAHLASDQTNIALAAIGAAASMRLESARQGLESLQASDVPSIARAARYALSRLAPDGQ